MAYEAFYSVRSSEIGSDYRLIFILYSKDIVIDSLYKNMLMFSLILFNFMLFRFILFI